MFLNADELHALTGCKRVSEQIAQLRKQKIPFWLDKRGRPVVLVDNLKAKGSEARLGAVR